MPSGRTPEPPTEDERRRVQLYAGYGLTQMQMGAALKRSKHWLRAHMGEELEHGKALMHTQIAGTIVQAALKGNMTAAIFYAKTQMGWSEKVHHRHHVHDQMAAPIPAEAFDILDDDELEFLERIARKLAAHSDDRSGQEPRRIEGAPAASEV